MPPKKAVTSIYDLARETGVSYSTVSRILNGRGNSPADVKKKVLDAARASNFKPKMQARRTTVSLVFDRYDESMLDDDYLLRIWAATAGRLALRDVAVDIYMRHNLSSMRTAMLDGIIILKWNDAIDELREISKQIPCVVMNTRQGSEISSVMSDHYQSGAMAAQHLLDNGHMLSSFVVNRLGSYGNSERLRGFLETYAKAGCNIPQSLVFDQTGGQHSMLEALDCTLKSGATAIFIGGDITVNFTLTAHLMGIKIPERLSVVTMECSDLPRCHSPALTGIKQPLDLVAAKTVDLLLKKIAERDSAHPEHLLIPENRLFKRESVACLKTQGATILQQAI